MKLVLAELLTINGTRFAVECRTAVPENLSTICHEAILTTLLKTFQCLCSAQLLLLVVDFQLVCLRALMAGVFFPRAIAEEQHTK